MSKEISQFIPYGRQYISEEDIAAVVDVLRSTFLTQGPVIEAFESAVAEKVGVQHGVAVNSATSALHIACLALGLDSGDRLWTSPITFVASANCGRYCGATVDFVDIEPGTGLMSVVALKAKLEEAESNGTLPKIVVPVHLAGSSCDMTAIGALAERYGFAVIEDASHAIGARYRGEPIGNCRYSAITIFSFHPVKIITTAEGGMATTNEPKLFEKMVDLRSHGITKDASRFELKVAGPWSYEQQDLGFNYRMTDLQAGLGRSQLQRLDHIIEERNVQLQHYRSLLSNIPASLLDVPENSLTAGHLAIIQLEDTNGCRHREVFEGMRNAGIGVQLHYSPVHLQPYYRRLGFKNGDYPIAEAYAARAMSLPLFPGLKPEERKSIVAKLRSLISA